MKRMYGCPHCGANLNPNQKIVLAARSGACRGLVLLSPQPGDYRVLCAPELDLEPGALVEFICPVCHESLTSTDNPELATLSFTFSTGLEGEVHFSRRFGERATWFVTAEGVRPYGDEAQAGQQPNFFGAGNREL